MFMLAPNKMCLKKRVERDFSLKIINQIYSPNRSVSSNLYNHPFDYQLSADSSRFTCDFLFPEEMSNDLQL